MKTPAKESVKVVMPITRAGVHMDVFRIAKVTPTARASMLVASDSARRKCHAKSIPHPAWLHRESARHRHGQCIHGKPHRNKDQCNGIHAELFSNIESIRGKSGIQVSVPSINSE